MDLSKFNVDSLTAFELGSLAFASVCVVFSVIAAFASRRFWFVTDAVIQVTGGLAALLMPTFTIGFYQLEKLQKDFTAENADGVHIHITRCVGLMMLSMAYTTYRLHDRDSDPTVFTSIVWSKIMGYSLVCVNLIYSVLVYGGVGRAAGKSDLWLFSDLLFFIGMVSILAIISSGLVQLAKLQSWGGYPETFTILNLHVRIDYFFTLVWGIVIFALPHWFLEIETTLVKYGNLHVYLMRVFGILCIGSGLLMGRAPNFLRDDDKVTLLECRIVQNVGLMAAQMYAHNSSTDFTNNFVFLGMGGVAMWTINAALGYWSVKGYPKLKWS